MRYVLLLLACVIFAQPQPYPTPGKASQEKQQTTRGEDTKTNGHNGVSHTVVTVGNAPVIQDSAQHKEIPSSADWWMRILTGVLAAAAIGQAYIYWRQKELMAGALLETQKAADAATKSAEVAERALEVTARAYLTAEDWKFETFKPDQSPIVRYTLHNRGKTRATLVKFWVQQTIEDQLPAEPIYESAEDGGHIPIEAGQACHRRFRGRSMSTQEYVPIDCGFLSIWFWGYHAYLDEFGIETTAGFCVRYEKDQNAIVLDTGFPKYHLITHKRPSKQ